MAELLPEHICLASGWHIPPGISLKFIWVQVAPFLTKMAWRWVVELRVTYCVSKGPLSRGSFAENCPSKYPCSAQPGVAPFVAQIPDPRYHLIPTILSRVRGWGTVTRRYQDKKLNFLWKMMKPCNTPRKNETENPQLTCDMKDLKSEIRLRRQLSAVACTALGLIRLG